MANGIDFEKFKTVLLEKKPSLLKGHKNFWTKEFVSLAQNILKELYPPLTVIENIDPGAVNRCPSCKTLIIFGDNYCSCCGNKLNWR